MIRPELGRESQPPIIKVGQTDTISIRSPKRLELAPGVGRPVEGKCDRLGLIARPLLAPVSEDIGAGDIDDPPYAARDGYFDQSFGRRYVDPFIGVVSSRLSCFRRAMNHVVAIAHRTTQRVVIGKFARDKLQTRAPDTCIGIRTAEKSPHRVTRGKQFADRMSPQHAVGTGNEHLFPHESHN